MYININNKEEKGNIIIGSSTYIKIKNSNGKYDIIEFPTEDEANNYVRELGYEFN